MPVRRVLTCFWTASLLSLLVAGCTADASSEDEDFGGRDTVTADELRSGLAATKGFVEPDLSPEELAAVMDRYPHVDPDHVIATNLLTTAIAYYDANLTRLRNHSSMVIVDFALSSAADRFFVIDMSTGEVAPHKVAHGSGSDNGAGKATRFSNVDDSHKSSLGFVLTGEVYSGIHGRSLRLDGLSSTNSNDRARAIVVHGASYVSDARSSRQGTSWGCFALDQHVKDSVISEIRDGALLYADLGDH